MMMMMMTTRTMTLDQHTASEAAFLSRGCLVIVGQTWPSPQLQASMALAADRRLHRHLQIATTLLGT